MKVTLKDKEQFDIAMVDEIIFGDKDTCLIKDKKVIKRVKNKELFRIEN